MRAPTTVPLLVLLAGLGLGAPASAGAQFYAFGQNKIQYRKLDWRVMKGPHVDLY
jgi:energy-converting hydrogenase Eha subunit G